MDSDEEDVSENDILDWYKNEVADIWDAATDSAFSDLSANLTEMFRQVMNNVKQRNQPNQQVSTGAATESNGHSSLPNGIHVEPVAGTSTEGTQSAASTVVNVTAEQLMAMLQDDEDWLENNTQEEEDNVGLSVQLRNEEQKHGNSSSSKKES